MNPQERIAELRKRNKAFLSGGTATELPHEPKGRDVQPEEVAAGRTMTQTELEVARKPKPGHQEGDLLRYEGRVWRVGLINDSRMRLDPITPNKTKIFDNVINDWGASVNVSPNAILPKMNDDQLDDTERRRAAKLIERGARVPEHVIDKESGIMAPAAAPPVGGGTKTQAQAAKPTAVAAPTVSPNRKANQERVARLQEKNRASGAAGAPVGNPKKTATKTVRPCSCGCGEEVTGYFAQGHDARFKSWLLKVERGVMPVKDLPKVVQDAYEWKKKGDGYIPTKNYKGEPHYGYETAQTAAKKK